MSQNKSKAGKTEKEWEEILTPEQFEVLRNKGTERPFSSPFELSTEDGLYKCAACGTPLFSSDTKYDSGCGWPSFFAPINNENVETHEDFTLGMKRTEIVCKTCGGHLGHVFNDGPLPTGHRYCINGVSLKFAKNPLATSEKEVN